MRIAVVAVSDKRSEALRRRAATAVREFSMAGHVTEVFESVDTRLSSYDFILVCSEPSSLMGNIGSKIPEQLPRGGSLLGKRAMALVVKSGLAPAKALSRLMTAMEKEGMVVTMGEIVSSDSEVVAAVREAPLTRG